jgi:hypothetical protein
VKKVPQTRQSKRSKKAKESEVSLEAHASTVSSDDVSVFSLPAVRSYTPFSDMLFSSGFGKEIRRLGH